MRAATLLICLLPLLAPRVKGNEPMVIHGIVRVVGNEPFSEVVVTSGGEDYLVQGPLKGALRLEQGKSVSVRGDSCSAPPPFRKCVTVLELLPAPEPAHRK